MMRVLFRFNTLISLLASYIQRALFKVLAQGHRRLVTDTIIHLERYAYN